MFDICKVEKKNSIFTADLNFSEIQPAGTLSPADKLKQNRGLTRVLSKHQTALRKPWVHRKHWRQWQREGYMVIFQRSVSYSFAEVWEWITAVAHSISPSGPIRARFVYCFPLPTVFFYCYDWSSVRVRNWVVKILFGVELAAKFLEQKHFFRSIWEGEKMLFSFGAKCSTMEWCGFVPAEDQLMQAILNATTWG